MVLCLPVYRLAEFRLRSRLAQTQQTIPDQVQKPTAHPTMRWVFQCFEGIELLHVETATISLILVSRPATRSSAHSAALRATLREDLRSFWLGLRNAGHPTVFSQIDD
jgi:hypothetical protein